MEYDQCETFGFVPFFLEARCVIGTFDTLFGQLKVKTIKSDQNRTFILD